MLKRIVFGMAALILAGQAFAYVDVREEKVKLSDAVTASASVLYDKAANSDGGRIGLEVGLADMRLAGSSTTCLFPSSLFTQIQYTLPARTRVIRLTLAGTAAAALGGDPSSTNYLRASIISTSLSGSAVTAGTEEAYLHFDKVQGGVPVSYRDLDPETQYTLSVAIPRAGNLGLTLLVQAWGKRTLSITAAGTTTF